MTDNNLRDRREDEPVHARKKQVVNCNKSGKSVYAMNKGELLDLFKCEVEEVTKGEFVLISELYVDTYGETYVYHGLDTERNKPIVIKVLPDSPGADLMEYNIHRLLHLPGFKTHPNILSLHAEADENTIEHPFVFVFLEKMEMSLEDYLEKKRDTVTSYPGNAIVQMVTGMMAGIQKGLRYMHDRHVAHLDIKTANILLRFANGNYMTPVPKISDFGLSQLMLSNNTFEHPKLMFEMDPYTGQRYVLGQLVTAHYRPIELKVRYSAFNAGKYDEFVAAFGNVCNGVAIDMWSVGVLFFSIMYTLAASGNASPNEYIGYFWDGRDENSYAPTVEQFGSIQECVPGWPEMESFLKLTPSSLSDREKETKRNATVKVFQSRVLKNMFTPDMVDEMFKMLTYNPTRRPPAPPLALPT